MGKYQSMSRPLGLSLAIITSVFLFSIIPLMQLGIDLMIENHLDNLDFTLERGDGTQIEPLIVGGEVNLVSNERLILQTLLGVGFFMIAVMAWRGRPAWSRYLMLAAVLSLTFLTALLTALQLFQPATIQTGLDSGQPVANSLLCGRLALTVLIPLYVVWYMNRAPARAFYRARNGQRPDERTLNHAEGAREIEA